MRATESFKLSGVVAGTYPVKPDGAGDAYLFGGTYELKVSAVTGAGAVVLNQLDSAGNIVPVNGTGATAIGINTYNLPPGRYTIVTSGFTAVTASLTRVPTSE